MIATLFVETESILTYFFIIATVTFTYDNSRTPAQKWGHLLLSAAVFGLVFKPLELAYGGYYPYLIMTLLFSILYCVLFLRQKMLIVLVSVFYLMYSVTSVKAIIVTLITPNIIDRSELQSVLTSACLYLTFILLFAYYHLHPIAPQTRMPWGFWAMFILTPLLIEVCIEALTQQFASNDDDDPALLVFSCLFAALLMTHFLSYTLMRVYESQMQLQFLSQKQALQLEHTQQTASIITQVRKERHELKNNYFYLLSLIKAQNYGEMSHFLEEEMGRRLELTDEFNTGKQIVDYILTQKVNEARASGIHVVTVAMLPPELPVGDEDLCALLMNLLDNAIEASRREEQGDIHIQIGVVKNYLSIQIKNRSSNDVLAQNPQLHTIKPDAQQHGIGLKIVRQTVNRNKGLFETYMESGYFVAAVMLPIAAGAKERESA